MSLKMKTKWDILFEVVNTLAIAFITFCCLYPMWHVFVASFSDGLRLLNHRGPLLGPLGFTTDGYSIILKMPGIRSGYINTIIYVLSGTAVSMLMITICSYALAQRGFKLRKLLMIMIVIQMYFSGGLIPKFLLIRGLGMLNTRWAIILPGAIGTWNMLVLRTAFSTAPKELEEAARIDGAGDITILLKIMIPVCQATMAVILLFYSVSNWNAWFSSLIYLPTARDKYPLQLILREILIASFRISEIETDSGTEFSAELIKYCSIIVSSVPILCLYPFLQRYFVKGVMLGSVKG